MSLNDLYNKISWIYEMPIFFENDSISKKQLYYFSIDVQKFLIFKLINTLGQYFGKLPGSPDGFNLSDLDSEKFKNSLENICAVWLSGLCDLSIEMIVNGLLDILNLKTEYQKFPPESVMSFYSICKKGRPPYYEKYQPSYLNDLKSIEIDEKSLIKIKEDSDSKRIECLININKTLGKIYKKLLIKKLLILENKEKNDKNTKIINSIKNDLLIIDKKYANI